MKAFRSPTLAALMVALVLLVSGVHLLHEQLASHPAGEVCDLCRFSVDNNSGLLQPVLPSILYVPAPVLYLEWSGFVSLERPVPLGAARAPPV